MRRERELKLLRKKRLIKRYSDFELSSLASEMKDYTYLLKSIQFPKNELKIIEKEEHKMIKEKKENKQELISKKKNEESFKYKKLYSFGNNNNNLEEINEKEEDENEEEYEGLRPKDNYNKEIRKRK